MNETKTKSESESASRGTGSSVIFKLFGALFLALGITVVYFTSTELLPFFTDDSNGIIKSLWAQDLENLSHDQMLPEAWLHLKTVKFSSAPGPANIGIERELNSSKPFIPTHADGTYQLNVFFDRWNESTTHKQGAMIQYSLVNLKTGNTDWELGRTLLLPDPKKSN